MVFIIIRSLWVVSSRFFRVITLVTKQTAAMSYGIQHVISGKLGIAWKYVLTLEYSIIVVSITTWKNDFFRVITVQTNKANRGVDLRHSTRNKLEIEHCVRMECLNIRISLRTILYFFIEQGCCIMLVYDAANITFDGQSYGTSEFCSNIFMCFYFFYICDHFLKAFDY